MIYDGYVYYSKGKRDSKNGITEYFKCSKYGPPVYCRAGLTSHEDGTCVVIKSHTCREHEAARNEEISRIDCTEEVREALEDQAIKNLRQLPRRVFKDVKEAMVKKYGRRVLLDLPSKAAAIGIVQRARQDLTGGDALREVVHGPSCRMSETDDRPFTRFSCTYADNGKMNSLLGFAHPALVKLLKYHGISLFVDGTFKVTPAPFAQCVIVMLFDQATELYMPIFYVLTTARDEWSYWHLFHWVNVCTGVSMQPAIVTCDFEWGIIKGVQDQFPEAFVVGCLFHWKQALRKRLVNLRVPADQINKAMERGVLDLLTVVREEKVDEAIIYVKTLIPTHKTTTLWNKFWKYFRETWMKKFPFHTWNISAMTSQNVTLLNRTNNPLESYNRFFGEKFDVNYPDLLHFVEVTKEEAIETLRRYNDVRGGIEEAPARPPVSYPEIPAHLQ
jgi:hypothetical protein